MPAFASCNERFHPCKAGEKICIGFTFEILDNPVVIGMPDFRCLPLKDMNNISR
jgi:hypothetical protein